MVVQANASRQPWTMVVHLENASTTRGTVMRTVGLSSLAFFAKTQFAIGLDSEGGSLRWCVGGQTGVAGRAGCASGVCEDGGGVAPVEHQVENDAADRSILAYPTGFCHGAGTNINHNPYCPRGNAVDKC